MWLVFVNYSLTPCRKNVSLQCWKNCCRCVKDKEKKRLNPGNVNSHIQMPRFLLTRFENENHSFFYYDVKKRYIGANGHAKSMYTERGYYPDVIEKYLNKELERPFSQFLQFVDSILDKPSFEMTNADENTIKQFLASLIIRSPLFIDSLKNNSVFFQFLSPTDQHTIAISRGMEEAQKKKIFANYFVSFTINKTTKPFVLPISGIYYYKLNEYTHVSLPISPTVAITMIESAGVPSVENEGITRMYRITQEKHVIEFNKCAFKEQCDQSYGYVISPSKDALEELLTLHDRRFR